MTSISSSLNTFFLSIFAKDVRFSNHIKSVRRRFQTLTLTYMNINLICLLAVFSLFIRFSFGLENAHLVFFYTLPLFALTFFWISKTKLDLAAMTLVIVFHISSKFASDFLEMPFMSLTGIMLYPYILLSLTSSLKIFFLNVFLCMGQFFYNAAKVRLIFDDETISSEQSRQISSLLYYVLFIFTSICFLSIFQKVTEAHIGSLAQSNFEKSEKLTQEVIQSMEAKDIFISMMSHEIRNPLNALKTSIEYLLQIIKDKTQLSILKNAKLSGEVLLNLVNNVLDAAKLKSDKMEISPIETDFVSVVEKALTINSESLKDKEIFAKAWISQDLPGLMWLDPSRLLQILLNLLSNAIKFTSKEGKIDIYVSWLDGERIQNHERLLEPFGERNSLVRDIGMEGFLEEMNPEENKSFTQNMESLSHQYQFSCNYNFNDVSPSNASKQSPRKSRKPWEILRINSVQRNQNQESTGYLKVQVQDTGCGIAENQLSRLFGMFEQSREHARMASGGTGLGLWVCKQLCQKMNGDIAVYSQKDIGTSFVFYLPVQNNNVRMTSIFRSLSPAKSLRALVVDDYATNRYMHKLFLEEQGVQVSVACDGQEAVEKYKNNRENPFGLILMDVQMPVMDGFSAASRIRQWEQVKNLPKAAIYFVTGEYFSEEDVLRIFKERGGGQVQGIKCLKKPLETEIIRDIVCKLK